MTHIATTDFWQGDEIIWSEPFARVLAVGDSVYHDERWYRVQEITVCRDVLQVRLYLRRR
jgi:hypothetical protein